MESCPNADHFGFLPLQLCVSVLHLQLPWKKGLWALPYFYLELFFLDFPTDTLSWCCSICCRPVAQSCQSLCDPWTVALKPPLSMGLSRQESWSGLSCPLQSFFPTQGSNPGPLCLLHWQLDSLPLSHQGSQLFWWVSLVVQGVKTLPAMQKIQVHQTAKFVLDFTQ